MSRVRIVFATVLPSMIAGGLLFASGSGHAESGRVVVAQADPPARRRSPAMPPVPPAPPAPPAGAAVPAPPTPATPPTPAHPSSWSHGGPGWSVSVHNGKVSIKGLEELVQAQLDNALRVIDHTPNVPPDARDRIKNRINAVRFKLKQRLNRLTSMDLDKMSAEMERMGDELEKDLEGLDNDLEQIGDKLGKQFAQKLGKDFAKGFPQQLRGNDDDDDDDDNDEDSHDADDNDSDDVVALPGMDNAPDPSDVRPRIAALKGLSLDKNQKAKLAQLRKDTEQRVEVAQRELDAMSKRLQVALGDNATSEDEIAKRIDEISAKEATIRKVRVLTWVKARRVLGEDQRKQVEAAVKHR